MVVWWIVFKPISVISLGQAEQSLYITTKISWPPSSMFYFSPLRFLRMFHATSSHRTILLPTMTQQDLDPGNPATWCWSQRFQASTPPPCSTRCWSCLCQDPLPWCSTTGWATGRKYSSYSYLVLVFWGNWNTFCVSVRYWELDWAVLTFSYFIFVFHY